MKTIAQQLNIKSFPFNIKDDKGNHIYYEDSCAYWYKKEYDSKGNIIYYEASNGYWSKSEYDSKGNEIYFVTSAGYWFKSEYDSNNKQIYYETSTGYTVGIRPKQTVEITLDEIAKKFNIDISQVRIKK